MYLVGWKEMAKHFGWTIRHLQRLHYTYLKIPFIKDGPEQNAPVRITPTLLELWYQQVREVRFKVKQVERYDPFASVRKK